MSSNEVNIKNSNMSENDEILSSNSVVTLNSMVLLVRIKHIDSRPIEPEVFIETSGSFVHILTQHIHPMHLKYLVHMKFV